MRLTLSLALAGWILLPAAALAQTAPGSASGGGAAACAAEIDGQSVDAMIADAGSVDELLRVTEAQIVELDRWLEDMKPALASGIRAAEMRELYQEGERVRGLNVDLRDALRCRKGG